MKEEVANNLDGIEVGKIKKSVIEKLYDKLKKNNEAFMNAKFDQLGEKMNKFSTQANASIQGMEKKFTSMYTTLIREFLLNLEKRIYANEIFNATNGKFIVKEIYSLKKQFDPEFTMEFEEFFEMKDAEHLELIKQVNGETQIALKEQKAHQEKEEENNVALQSETPKENQEESTSQDNI